MSQDKQKSIAAMRTFARDLDRERGGTPDAKTTNETDKEEGDVVVVAEKPAVEHHAPARKMAPIKAMPKTEPTKETTSVPEHIPAFHELAKKTKETPKKNKGITTDTPKAGGTIITDTKHDRKPFFKQVGQSLLAWYESQKKKFKRRAKKTYTVTDTTRRKGVVQKATSKTGTIFSADNATLMEEIKRRQRAERGHDDEEELLWTPNTEPGFALLDGEVVPEETITPKQKEVIIPEAPKVDATKPANVSIQFKKRTLPKPVAPTPSTPVPELVNESDIEKATAIVTPPPAAPEPIIVSEPEPAEPEVEELPEPAPVFETPASTSENEADTDNLFDGPIWKPGNVAHLNTNMLTVVVVGALFIVIVIGFSGFIFIKNLTAEPVSVADLVIEPISSPNTSLYEVVITEASQNELTEKLNSAVLLSNPGTLAEFVFVNNQTTPIAPRELAKAIGMQSGQVFAQTLSNIRAVKTNTGARGMLFKVTDNIDARGGLLDWELTMYEDMAGLLGETEKNQAGTFYDVPFNGYDLRVFKNNTEVLLVYGFSNDNTVIVATSLDTFIVLSEL